MKPIGTITVYYPFLDSNTKEMISNLVDNAYNFREFVTSLTDYVCLRGGSDYTIFLAVHFAALLFDFDCLDKIAKLHGKLDIIRPNLFYGSAYQGKHEDMQKVLESADDVISSNPPDWLLMEMYLVKLEAEYAQYPTQVYGTSTIDNIEELFQKKPDLDFMKARMYDALTMQANNEKNVVQALEYNQTAIENAEKYDDLNRLAHLYRTRSAILQATNRSESEKLLLRSHELMQTMGDKGGDADILYLLSKLESIRGYYDKAIEHNLECVTLWESIGMPIGLSALTLSTLYNVIGYGDAGLEWGKMAENELANRPALQPRAFLNQAWSMVLLKKPSEAHDIIDQVRESVLKSGLESNLAWFNFISSVLEIAEEEFDMAASNLEESMDIYERSGGLLSFYICLHHRAKLEVLATSQTSGDGIGPWLTLLEQKAREENLPGILGQALYLKAKLFENAGDISNFHEVIEELVALIRDSKLTFLEPAVNHLISSRDSED